MLGYKDAFQPKYNVTCFYQQDMIRETVVSKHYLGLFQCEDRCGQITYEHEFYTEQHLETMNYTRRWGRQFNMNIMTPLLAVSGKCRELAF
jgi:hypothetical protein